MTTTTDLNPYNLNHPLRLAVGSHQPGSGKGCAMNVISWESGDTEITDLPACADQMLAKLVQSVNDTHCTHRDGDLLCPACSLEVLALAHRTVGTAGLDDGGRVWVRIAVHFAREVAHLCDDPRVEAALVAAERWIDDPTPAHAALANAAGRAARSASYAAGRAAAAFAASHAACAADRRYPVEAAVAVTYAADAAGEPRIAAAHRAIDLFEQLTGHTPITIDPAVTATAVRQMVEVPA